MLKRVMVMWVVDMVFKTTTLIPNVNIKERLRIFMGMLTRVMLAVGMVLQTSILIYNIVVTIF